MSNKAKPAKAPDAEATPTPEAETVVSVVVEPETDVSPEPETASAVEEVAALGHESVSEGEDWQEEPVVPLSVGTGLGSGYPSPALPYTIEELGAQPVSLASKTWASNFGPGGAPHTYKIAVYDPEGEIAHLATLNFQKGATGEGGGINGIADSTLLSILADRWAAFQAGPFASEQTGKALECIQQAVAWLNQRTAERQARGVEGKHEA